MSISKKPFLCTGKGWLSENTGLRDGGKVASLSDIEVIEVVGEVGLKS